MNKKNKWILIALCFFFACHSSVNAQSIAEKKANLRTTNSDLDGESDQFLLRINQESLEIHTQIQKLYETVSRLYQEGAPPEEYRALLDQINERKRYLLCLEESWREIASKGNRTEGYGLWHAPETSLEQLIIDYGSQDFVYLIPPDVGSIKLSIASNLPIPRSCWNTMLEHILTQNGVGIKLLNSYLRQLYLIKQNNAHLKSITNNRCDLETLPADARVSFVLSPDPSEVRRTYLFLEKFINPNATSLQVLGRDILLVGQVSDIQDLLKLCDFVSVNRGDKDYRLIPVSKIRADEMAKILAATFDQNVGEGRGASLNGEDREFESGKYFPDTNGLKIIVLNSVAEALFIVGTKDEIKKAEEIVNSVENQIGGARDRTIFWYNVKHSEPEELADVLYRIYGLMINTGIGTDSQVNLNAPNEVVVVQPNISNGSPPTPPPTPLGFQEGGGFVINPAPAQPGVFVQTNPNKNRDNFIVDLKTGAIVMVVEADILPKIRDLLRKLDVPKKMVQIETLLFEKVLTRENNFGLNLLKIGNLAHNQHFTGVDFNNIFPRSRGSYCGSPSSYGSRSSSCSSYPSSGSSSCSSSSNYSCGGLGTAICDLIPGGLGVFEFLISRKRTDSGIPAFDIAYRFLLSQDDVQINSSPSILTINQTPATIAINEDISINTGVFQVDTPGGFTLKDAFARAQYGTTISIKPTIHMRDESSCEEEDDDYVTLETDITFDTIHPGGNPDRPDVTRRHITNQVQVIDGETVVIGNLRCKVSADTRDSIPFIGELPGIGKLFSETTTKNRTTEMFIFITPKIVKDPKEELQAIRQELLCRRPGDLPYFLDCLEEAYRYEKSRLMAGSLNMLLGNCPTRYYVPEGEYDGR